MDILTELEALVTVCSEEDVSNECIQQWQQLFSYSKEEATKLLKEHRIDLNRHRISNEYWKLTVPLRSTGNFSSRSSRKPPTSTSYLLKLKGPFNTPEKVRELAGLQQTPTVHATADDSESQGIFVIIDSATKEVIVQKFATQAFQPFFQRYVKAEKALSIASLCPTLGIDTTIPQHRLSEHEVPFPTQDQYPHYQTLLCLEQAVIMHRKIKTWAGRYRAMIDALPTDFVEGWAYKVTCREHEQALQYYETDKYEVVRCNIHIEEEAPSAGLTFRFIDEDELD